MNLALKKTKEHEKNSIFLTPYTTGKYTVLRKAIIGLEEHLDKVSLGDFPCRGLELSLSLLARKQHSWTCTTLAF